MMAARKLDHLIEQLPNVRGALTADAPIARLTWFRVGGNAEVLFEPADQDDLQAFLQALPREIDVTVLGGASNLIVRDGGITGVTIKLGRPFAQITVDDIDNRGRRGSNGYYPIPQSTRLRYWPPRISERHTGINRRRGTHERRRLRSRNQGCPV